MTPLPPLAFPEVPAYATATLPLRSHAPASALLGSCREGTGGSGAWTRELTRRALERDQETAVGHSGVTLNFLWTEFDLPPARASVVDRG